MLSLRSSTKLDGLQKCVQNGHMVKDLFKIMISCEDLWMQAYVNIQGNKGAMTKGVDNSTVDGFSDEFARATIMKLKDGQYKVAPVRRVFIPKANGKTRPLGIPRFEDKLVQEVVRILLEAIYEPIFSPQSHGFRPKRECHTALLDIAKWSGTSWFVEFDIKGYFDNIDHEILIELLEEKIDDRRFIKLIKSLLKAGYCEDWKYHKTYSGTPQGGVISPLFANIYLHRLDSFLHDWKSRFEKGGKQKQRNPEYRKLNYTEQNLRTTIGRKDKQIKEGRRPNMGPKEGFHYFSDEELAELKEEREKLVLRKREINTLKKQIPASVSNDENFKRFRFVRYADDFLVGIIGSKQEAEDILQGTKHFLDKELKLELSEEKTAVRNAREEGTKFLNFNIRKSNNLVSKTKKVRGKRIKARNSGVSIRLEVPTERVVKFSSKYGTLEPMKSLHVPQRIDDSDVEILLAFNQEFRGFAQYYAIANDVKTKLNKLQWLVESSLLKTFANKYKTTVGDIVTRYKIKEEFIVKTDKRDHKFFRLKTLQRPSIDYDTIKKGHLVNYKRTSLEERIAANECEYCGKQDGYYEIHHIRKLKDIAKKKKNWVKQMIAMQRKTMVLCVPCHDLLHSGKLPDNRQQLGF